MAKDNIILYKAKVKIAVDDTTHIAVSDTMSDANKETLATWMSNLSWTEFSQSQDSVITYVDSNRTNIGGRSCGATEYIFKNQGFNASFGTVEALFADGLEILRGVSYTDVAAAPVAVAAEAAGTTIAAGTIYTLLNKDGDGTAVGSIVVSDTGGALVLNTDYTVGVDAQGRTYLVFLLATTGATTVAYSYTPSLKKINVETVGVKEVPRFMLCIEGCLVNGKNKRFYLGHVALTNDSQVTFQSINSTEAPAENPRTFEVSALSDGFLVEDLDSNIYGE